MSRLSERLIVDDEDDATGVVAPPRPSKKRTRKTRSSPRVAADSLYSTTATPHSSDGYSRMPSERADDLYASPPRLPAAATLEPEQTDTDYIDDSLLEAELADGKQRRYTCFGACAGCHMTKTQYGLSLLLVLLLTITVVLLVVFLAVIPAIIASTIASSVVSVSSVSISAPTNASFRLNSSFLVSNTGAFAASLSPMTVSLSYRTADGSLSPTVGRIAMPAIVLPGGQDVTVGVDTDFAVAEQSSFDAFMHATLMQDNITWHLDSAADVDSRVAGIALPTYHSIPFAKDVTVPGCGGLNTTTVQSFDISHPAATTGDLTNLTLHISLLNPSALSLSELGTLHFEVRYRAVRIGDVYSYNTALLPGNNSLTMHGTLLQSNTSAENELVARFVAGEVAVAQATAAPLDASSIPLFNGGLQGLSLNTALPGYAGPPIIQGVQMSGFVISFNRSTPDQALVSSNARAAFGLPANVDMPVLGVGATNITAIAYLNSSAPLGVMTALNVPSVFESNGGNASLPDYIHLAVPPSPLQVSAEQAGAFSQFASDLLLSTSASMQLQLLASPVTNTPLGNLSLSDVPASASVAFIGMNRFVDPRTNLSLMRVLSFDIVRSSPDWLLLDVTLNITNPSNVSLASLGDLRLDMAVNGTRIGGVTVSGFELPLGTTQQRAVANLSRPTSAAMEAASIALVSAMINRTNSDITLHGGLQQPDGSVVAGTDIPLLQQAVSSFSSPTVFPGLAQQLISYFHVDLQYLPHARAMLGGCTQLYVNTTMYVHNPFSTYMYLTAADVDVYISPLTAGAAAHNVSSMQVKMGDWRVDMSGEPLVVPPHSPENGTAVGPFLIRLTLGAEALSIVQWVFGGIFDGTIPILQLDSVGTIRTNLSTADPAHGGAATDAFEQRVRVDARNVSAALKLHILDPALPLPEDLLPPVLWGPPLLGNDTCNQQLGCRTQCTVPCFCDVVLCRYGDCSLGYVSRPGLAGLWGDL